MEKVYTFRDGKYTAIGFLGAPGSEQFLYQRIEGKLTIIGERPESIEVKEPIRSYSIMGEVRQASPVPCLHATHHMSVGDVAKCLRGK